MGALARRWAATWTAPSVSDDGHWTTAGAGTAYASASGNIVTAESAMRLSAVWACVKILSESVAQLPCILYDRLSGGARERSTDPLAWTLANAPNDEQTPIEFFEQMMGWALFRRFAFAEIVWRGHLVEQVIPRHPDRIRRSKVSNAVRRYEYLEDDGLTWRPLDDSAVLRMPGTPVLDHARDSFGMAQALERYAARSFKQGVRPSGFIAQDPGTSYSEEARAQLKARITEEHGGSDQAGGVLWLPEGLKWNQIGMTNQQAEFIATKAFTVADVSRWFTVPPYRLSLLESGTVSYASVKTQDVDFVVYTLMPWLVRIEQTISRDLITDKRRRFAEFLTAGMMRGTTQERYAVYAIALAWGIMSVNEVRRLENLNPRAGGDAYLTPLNMTSARAAEAGSPADRLLTALTSDAAGRIVNRETRALPKLLERGDEKALDDFYAEHAAYVSEALHVPLDQAQSYAARQRKAAVDVNGWDSTALVADLCAMTLPEK